MHSSVSRNQVLSPSIVMLVSWLHSESARACRNCAPSDTLLTKYSMWSEVKHRLLMMAQPANSSSLLRLVAVVPPKYLNVSDCREWHLRASCPNGHSCSSFWSENCSMVRCLRPYSSLTVCPRSSKTELTISEEEHLNISLMSISSVGSSYSATHSTIVSAVYSVKPSCTCT